MLIIAGALNGLIFLHRERAIRATIILAVTTESLFLPSPAFDDAPDFLSGLDAVLEHPVENENSWVEEFGFMKDSETWAFA